MSPEEILPMLHPQIYQVSNVELIGEEFPAVSVLMIKLSFCNLDGTTTEIRVEW